MSLVENIARKRPRTSALLGEVRRLKEAGHKNSTIADMLGMGHTYIDGIAKLLKGNETRLVEQVEAGTIPLSIAVKIASAATPELQRALNEAYRAGTLRGAKLRAVERAIASRSRKPSHPENKPILSGADLMREYEGLTETHRAVVFRASVLRERLVILTESMKHILADATFVRLMFAEGLNTMPEQLAARVTSEMAAKP